MLTLLAPSRPLRFLAAPMGLALMITLPLGVLLAWRLNLSHWQIAAFIAAALWPLALLLYRRGRRPPFEKPMGLAVGPPGILALAGGNRVWVIDWADLDRVDEETDVPSTGNGRPVLKLSARGGGKSKLVEIGGPTVDAFEVTVDSGLVEDSPGGLAALLRWYRDHPESRSELERTVCIRHRLELLTS